MLCIPNQVSSDAMSIAETVTPVVIQPLLALNPRRFFKARTTDHRHHPRLSDTAAECAPSPGASPSAGTNATADKKAQSLPSDPRSLNDLTEFEKTVDENTRSRFDHVHSQLEKPLLAYIRRKLPEKKYRPISLRLMVLGTSEDDAKPCIVAFCPELQSKKVRKFFDKDSVKKLCQPEDGTLPSFEAFVSRQPPNTKHASDDIDVLLPIAEETGYDTVETYCGAPITLRKPSGLETRCTLGGVIQTTWPNGDFRLYGLTVHHPLLDDPENEATTGTDSDEGSSNWDLELSDSDSDVDEESEDDDTQPSCVTNQPQLASVNSSAPWAGLELAKIGTISKSNPKYEKCGAPKRYHDWALIELFKFKPNRILSRKLPNSKIEEERVLEPDDLIMPASPLVNTGKRQSVVLLSGSEGLKRGTLSSLPSKLLLAPGKKFVDTLIVNLDCGKGMWWLCIAKLYFESLTD